MLPNTYKIFLEVDLLTNKELRIPVLKYNIKTKITGPAAIEDIAQQVVTSIGPSGSNKEYVYNLAEAMRQLAPNAEDEHLFALEKAVKEIDPDLKNLKK